MEIPNDLSAALPLTETTYFILLSLLPQPKHGYAIMKNVQALSEDRVILSTGTLYGAIKRLLEQGWIERVALAEEEQENGRERKAYALTRTGHRMLEVETERLQALIRASRQVAALDGKHSTRRAVRNTPAGDQP